MKLKIKKLCFKISKLIEDKKLEPNKNLNLLKRKQERGENVQKVEEQQQKFHKLY